MKVKPKTKVKIFLRITTRLKEHKVWRQVRRSTPEQVDPWREHILEYFRLAVLLRIQKLYDWDVASLLKTSYMLAC